MPQKIFTKLAFIFIIFQIMIHNNSISQTSNEYKIGVENTDYYPIHKVNDQEEYLGFSREIFDLFAKKYNLKFKFEPRPLNRLFREYIKNEFDFKYPDSPEWQKDLKENHKIIYSNPILEYIDGLLTRVEDREKNAKFIGAVQHSFKQQFSYQY